MSDPTQAALRFLILQHPQEAAHPLGTAKLLSDCLSGVELRVGLSWPNLRRATKDAAALPSQWAVLHVGTRADRRRALDGLPAAERNRACVFLDRRGAPVLADAELRNQLEGLVLLDGNWKQAKTLWWRNAWLLKLKRLLLLEERPSIYGDLRREPREDCLSTFEAACFAAVALGRIDSAQPALDRLSRHLDDLRRS